MSAFVGWLSLAGCAEASLSQQVALITCQACANEPLRCTPKRKTKTLDVKLTPSKAIEGIDSLSVNHFSKFLLVGRRNHDPIMVCFLPFQHLPTRSELREVLGGLIDGSCGKQGQRASDFYIDSMLGELIACLAEGY